MVVPSLLDPEPVRAALLAHRERARPLCAYVYDPGAVRDRARAVRAALPGWAELYYAVKANAHPDVLRAVAGEVDGFEVGSYGEAALVTDTLGHRVPLAFSGPAKTDPDLAGALELGPVQFNVESAHELRRLALAAGRAGVVARVAVRVNRRGVALPGSHLMTGADSQFGVDEDDLPEMLSLAGELPEVDLVGLHLHAVSNNTDAAAHAAFVAEALAFGADFELPVLDVGGGIGVDYRGGPGFDLAGFAAALRSLVPPPGTRVLFELGRYLAADAGWYATEVIDVKRGRDRCFAVVRGGMHQFRLPSAWRMSHPFTVLPVAEWDYPWPRPAAYDEAVDVAGELCTPRDILARGARVERLRAGDVLVFERAGAYGWEISHHDFLRHPHPAHLVLPPGPPALLTLV